jgi:N-acetyl-anhydromuramyl-L-alanine amidase AmpD
MNLRSRSQIEVIVVHCSDTVAGDVASIRRYHTQHNGWSDIGYHYVIRRDGAVETGRGLEFVGAHVEGANTGSIGICLVGKDTFEPEQFASLKKLIGSLRWMFGRPLTVRGHREFSSAKEQGKTCPNFDVAELGL